MGVIVGEGAQAVELLLAGGVPEGELDVDVVDKDVVDVVFKDGGFVDGGEIAVVVGVLELRMRRGGWDGKRMYPRVKTLRREVFPLAPSPLRYVSLCIKPPGVLRRGMMGPTYKRTSFRCTVLLPPQSGMLMQ